jgi:hypothetical protein
MKKKTNKILPKAQYAGGMGPGGKYPGKQPDRKTPPPRGLTYTEDAAPLQEGYITPQQWVNTWNPTTNSYDRTLKNAVRDPKFVNRERSVSGRGPTMKKGGSLRRQASSKGLRTSKKHK